MEHRTSHRYHLRLPIEVVRQGRIRTSILGETQNVSSSGVLFRAHSELRIGDRVEYVITLSTHPDYAAPVQIRCFGKVVRFKRESEVAVTLERHQFDRGQQPIPVSSLHALPARRGVIDRDF